MIVGKYTYGSENIKVRWGGQAELRIGKFCSIADNVTVWLGGNHRIDWITTYPFGSVNTNIFSNPIGEWHPKTNGDVIIGNDVWIGANVTIMSGVKIGDGAVIANGSHVVESVKPYSIVGGNPAKFYYFRFTKEIIDKLLDFKWWDLADEEINKISPLLCSNNFDDLFEQCKKFRINEQRNS